MMARVTLLLVAVLAFTGAIALNPAEEASDVAATNERATTASCEFDPERALETPIEELLREDDPVIGNPDSEVIVVEFFDPNCVHCHTFHDTWKEITDAYEDQVRFHKLPFPLWDYSMAQIEAMLVAQRAGRYYEMIDMQIAERRNDGLSIEELADMGAELGFDRERFKQVLERGPLQNDIQQRRREAQQAGVRSTPTVTINGQTLADRSFDCMSQKIEEALTTADAL